MPTDRAAAGFGRLISVLAFAGSASSCMARRPAHLPKFVRPASRAADTRFLSTFPASLSPQPRVDPEGGLGRPPYRGRRMQRAQQHIPLPRPDPAEIQDGRHKHRRHHHRGRTSRRRPDVARTARCLEIIYRLTRGSVLDLDVLRKLNSEGPEIRGQEGRTDMYELLQHRQGNVRRRVDDRRTRAVPAAAI